MGRVISDDDMAKLEAEHGSSPPKKFISDKDMEHLEASQPGYLESAARGLAQGATGGFMDELTGAIRAPLGAAKEIANKFGAGYDDPEVRNYRATRDMARGLDRQAQEANPNTYLVGNLAGAAGALPAGVGTSLAGMAGIGAAQGVGNAQSDSLGGIATDAAMGAGFGASGYGIGKAVEKWLPRAVESLGEKAAALGGKSKTAAEKFALNATGATGVLASKFDDDLGRYLLDKGIIKFGNRAADVEKALEGSVDEASAMIGKVLDDMDASGVTASVDNIVSGINGKIAQLKQVPGNDKFIRSLQNEVDRLIEAGKSDIPISAAERGKRAFQAQTNYNSKPSKVSSSKEMASAFRGEVERAAEQASPELAKQFLSAKDQYGKLKPVLDATVKRSHQQVQQPIGGLADTAAGLLFAPVVGTPAAISGPIARRSIQPRIASSSAVTFDKIGDILKTAPERFGKFAAPLREAEMRGPAARATTQFILQQTHPEFRQMMEELEK